MTFSTKMIDSIPFYAHEKVAIFIDGSNLHSAARALDFDIDYCFNVLHATVGWCVPFTIPR